VEAACGVWPALPEWLTAISERPERVTALPADQSAVERFVLATSRAAQEGAAA
jgi:threonine synthase